MLVFLDGCWHLGPPTAYREANSGPSATNQRSSKPFELEMVSGSQERRFNKVISSMMAKVRTAAADVHPTRAALDEVKALLLELSDLWREHLDLNEPLYTLPASGSDGRDFPSTRTGRFELGVWIINRVVSTVPHDHSQSWAVIAGITGVEYIQYNTMTNVF